MKTRLLASFSALLAIQLLFVGNAMAGWELDNERSTVQFMSVKNASIAELHYFHALAGEVADDGQARVSIDLDSIETLIPIRNQRLRELLFETVRFPAATLTTTVPEAVKSLENGESVGTPLATGERNDASSAEIPARSPTSGKRDVGTAPRTAPELSARIRAHRVGLASEAASIAQ